MLAFNVAISLTSELAVATAGRTPLHGPYVTFIPAERYYVAQLFFLPVLRTVMWLLAAAVVHLVIRLAGRHSDLDTQLMIGGLVYVGVLPTVLVLDWLALATGVYFWAGYAMVHGVVAVTFSVPLTVVGVRTLLGVPPRVAVAAVVGSLLVTIPLLATFAIP